MFTDEPTLRGHCLTRSFGASETKTVALHEVSLDLYPGQTLGLVGESGSGKTTTAQAVLQLVRPTSGSVRFQGTDLTELRGEALRKVRRELQVVFQNPYASLNPRMRIRTSLPLPAARMGAWASRLTRASRTCT